MMKDSDAGPDKVPGLDDPGLIGAGPNPNEEMWEALLTGKDDRLLRTRRIWRHVPSAPRCKVCASPFHGPGGAVARIFMHGPTEPGSLLCRACFGRLQEHPGGAEVPLSILFADVRGSTGIAERTAASTFSRLLQRFYDAAASAIDEADGVVDKFLGDGVMALFIPVIAGEAHAGRAIQAGRDILRRAAAAEFAEAGMGIGVGVHSGLAFAGAVGAGSRIDFTALGDAVNVAARLGGEAQAGELLVSAAAWENAGEAGPSDDERRVLQLKGRSDPLEVVVVR